MKRYVSSIHPTDFKYSMNFLSQINLFKTLLITGLTSLSITVGASANANQIEQTSEQYVASSSAAAEKIHVYGQVPRPNALRTGYVVFQETEDQVIGAYYQPYSEFSCFIGDLDNRELDVNFVSFQGQELKDTQILLSDLHELDTPGATDKKVIQACRQQVSQSL